MIYETKEQADVKKKYFDQNQSDGEQAGYHEDMNGKETQPLTLRKLFEV